MFKLLHMIIVLNSDIFHVSNWERAEGEGRGGGPSGRADGRPRGYQDNDANVYYTNVHCPPLN